MDLRQARIEDLPGVPSPPPPPLPSSNTHDIDAKCEPNKPSRKLRPEILYPLPPLQPLVIIMLIRRSVPRAFLAYPELRRHRRGIFPPPLPRRMEMDGD